jgi:hypothetical protein
MATGIQIEFDEVETNFTIAPNQILYNRALSSDSRLLWIYLRSHKIGYALGYRQMEADLGWSEATVRKNLKALQQSGYVGLIPTREGSRNGRLLISLHLPQTLKIEGSKVEGSESKGLNNTNNINKTIKETIYAQDEPERLSLFDEFWDLYPRKVGKGAAKRAWHKATRDTMDTLIIRGVKRLASDPNLPETQYIPYPATWLNAEGWSNDPYPERKRTAEELEAIRAEKYSRERQASLAAAKEIFEQNREAESRAVPAPLCEHGSTIVRCRTCLRKMSDASDSLS